MGPQCTTCPTEVRASAYFFTCVIVVRGTNPEGQPTIAMFSMYPRFVVPFVSALVVGVEPTALTAGDHYCVVHFDLEKVEVNGAYTVVGSSLNYGDSITVTLLPGEVVRLHRVCPGCNNCPPLVGVLRHVGDPATFASQSDPLLDTLWINHSVSASFATPGSYFLRGCPCYSLGGGSRFSLRILSAADQIATEVEDQVDQTAEVWAAAGQLMARTSGPADLNLVDMMGRTVFAERIISTSEMVAIPTGSLPSGNYIVILMSESAVIRKQVHLN